MYLQSQSSFEAQHGQGTQALRKDLTIVALLGKSSTGLGVTEIASLTGIERSTAHRLLKALQDYGWVLCDHKGRRYLAPAIRGDTAFEGLQTHSQLPSALVQQVLQMMRRLARKTGDTVYFVCRQGNFSLSLHREIGAYPVQMLSSYPGNQYPLGIGAAGLAILTLVPQQEAQEIIHNNSALLHQYNGMTAEKLTKLRSSSVERGFAVMQNHVEKRAMGVGCALPGTSAIPSLGISVSASLERMSVTRQMEVARDIKAEFERIATYCTA